MKKCRSCQQEIDQKATKCPFCQTKQGNWAQRHPILTGLVVIIILFIVIGSTSSKKSSESAARSDVAKLVESAEPTSSPTPTPLSPFVVGQEIKMTDYQLVVTSVKKGFAVAYLKPKAGNEYVKVNVTIQNNSDKEVSYNGYDFKIQNSEGNQTNQAIYSESDNLGTGSLAAGGKVSGSLVFEAPKADPKLELIYQPNIWLDNQRITVELQ